MIEEITIYRCPYCKAEFKTTEETEKCMINHKVPKEIKDWTYIQQGEHPRQIIVSFGDEKRDGVYILDHLLIKNFRDFKKFNNDSNS